MSVTDYIERLRRELAGRAPERLVRPPLGNILFILADAQGGRHRMTVRFEPDGARVLAGAGDDERGQSAIIRAPLASWIAYFHDGDLERMAEVDFFGDVELLDTLAKLLALKVSPLALRASVQKNRGR